MIKWNAQTWPMRTSYCLSSWSVWALGPFTAPWACQESDLGLSPLPEVLTCWHQEHKSALIRNSQSCIDAKWKLHSAISNVYYHPKLKRHHQCLIWHQTSHFAKLLWTQFQHTFEAQLSSALNWDELNLSLARTFQWLNVIGSWKYML